MRGPAMAAPEKFFDYDFLDDGLGQDIKWVAPQIGSALTPHDLNSTYQGFNAGWVFEWSGSDLGGLYGARKPLPAARDISARRFLWVAAFTNAFATNLKFADLADGGVRFYLTDSAGAYRGYILYGRDVTGNDPNPFFAFGSFISFNNALSQMWWCIDLDRTPDYSSGTLDLTDIVAVEVHVKNNLSISNTSNGRAGFGYLLASGNNIIRAGEIGDPANFTLLPQPLAAWTSSNLLYPGGGRQGQGLTIIYDGANGNNWATIVPVHVGDGSTATYFRQGRGTLSVQLSMEAIRYRIALGDTPRLLPCYLPDDANERTHTVNQSASDDVEFDSVTWSGYDTDGREYALEVRGSTSGTCKFINNLFARAQFVRLRHATATDCIFDACGGVEINADTGMTGSTIRNAPAGSSALRITGAAGDYSAIEVRLNNPLAAHDIALGSGGGGTYDLSGVTVPVGYTLRVHNDNEISGNLVPDLYAALLDGEWHPQTATLRLDTNDAPGAPLPDEGIVTFSADFEKTAVAGTVTLYVRTLLDFTGPQHLLTIDRVTGQLSGTAPAAPYGVIDRGDAWRLWIEADFTGDNRWIMEFRASDSTYAVRAPMVLQGADLDLDCPMPCYGGVTVILAGAMQVETSTAGGAITIASPPATYRIAFPAWPAGTRYRVYNVTADVEIANALTAQAGLTVDLVLGVDVAAGDVVQVRGVWASGASANLPEQRLFVVPVGGGVATVPEAMAADEVYAANAVDGFAVTKFEPDYVAQNIRILASVPFTAPELYAWSVASLMHPDGIRYFVGAFTALDQANYRINADVADVYLDNTTTTDLVVRGARVFRDDGEYPALRPGTGGATVILQDWTPVALVTVSTGSGLSAEQAAQLAATADAVARIPAAPAAVSDVPTAAQTAAAVRSVLPELDVPVSTRAAPADLPRPLTAAEAEQAAAAAVNGAVGPDIAAIRERTDRLPDNPASATDVEEAALL